MDPTFDMHGVPLTSEVWLHHCAGNKVQGESGIEMKTGIRLTERSRELVPESR